MIVVQLADPILRSAVMRAAPLDEDVVSEQLLALRAIEWGSPRLLVCDEGRRLPSSAAKLPVVELDPTVLRRWDLERRTADLPIPRLDDLTRRMALLLERSAQEYTWVDGALADLSRAAGARLPMSLRSFARRVLEFPLHYTTLYAVAEACGTSRGALKARFRRRSLVSPSTYLRWLRLMAVAEHLSDRRVTIAAAARRGGFTSGGNLCRAMAAVCQMTPTEARTVRGWNRLVINFAWRHLSPSALDGWADMTELFARRVA